MDGRGVSHSEQTRIVLRPLGNALPLGFFSFAIGMLLLGCFALGFIPVGEKRELGMTLVAFVFPLQLVATVLAYLARDTLGGTTLGLFAASWLALGWADIVSPPGARSVEEGIYLFGFATVAALLALLSAQSKPLFTLLLTASVVRMVANGVFEIGGAPIWFRVSGGFGLALTALALYGGTALALEDMYRRQLIPLFRRGGAERAFQGYDEQLDRLQSEAGIRQQL